MVVPVRDRLLLLLVLFSALAGCGSQRGGQVPAETSRGSSNAATEMLVRAALARVMKVDADSIQMDRPIGDPPLNADESSFVATLLELESRAGISITEDIIDRHAGKTADGPAKVTPNQIVRMVEDAPKVEAAKRSR
jgi:hypothetical protein